MSDQSFRAAVLLIGEAKRQPSAAAISLIFDRYRVAGQDQRDAIVLALIGEEVAGAARRRASTSPAEAA